MCADRCQQHPIETVDRQTAQVPSILHDRNFYSIVHHIHLTKQHRLEDEELMQILNHLRHYRPSDDLLEGIQGSRVLCSRPTPYAKDEERVQKERPTATFFNISRKATNFVNELAIDFLFRDVAPHSSIVICRHLVLRKRPTRTLPRISSRYARVRGKYCKKSSSGWTQKRFHSRSRARCAFERFRRLENLYFLTPTEKNQYRPGKCGLTGGC